MSAAIPAIIGAVGAVGGSLINKKSQDDASDANVAATEQANQINYQKWLMSRGVGSDGSVVNTKYPMWMGTRPPGPTQRTLVKRGEGVPNYGNAMGSAATVRNVPAWAMPGSAAAEEHVDTTEHGASMTAPISKVEWLVGNKDYDPADPKSQWRDLTRPSKQSAINIATGPLKHANDPLAPFKWAGKKLGF